MKEQLKKALTSVLVLTFFCCFAYSQSGETGALEGTVKDTEGGSLPGVEVTIASPNMMLASQSRITDVTGKFRFVLLQPGTYSVEARLEGFAPQRREEVRLFVGQTLTVDFFLEIGRLEEEVLVIAESPLIDVKDSALSTAEFDEQVLNDIAYDNEMYVYNLILLSPGSTSVYHGASAFGGTARAGNSYLVDGVEVGNPSYGISWLIPDAQSMSEARVSGLGANAEVDGFTGVQMSMIVKSGGNTFDGMLQFFYNDYGWTSENFDVSDHPLYQVPPQTNYYDARFQIGGPLVKDKLWLFGSVYWNYSGHISGEGQVPWGFIEPRYMIKLTYQASPSTRFTALRTIDDFNQENAGQSVYRPLEASEHEGGAAYVHNITMFHSFTDSTFAEFKIAHLYDDTFYHGYAEPDPRQVPGHYNSNTGIYSVNFNWYLDWYDYRTAGIATLSHHADNFIQGSHDFKFGAEVEVIGTDSDWRYSGGFFYVDDVYTGGEFKDYAYSYGYVYNVKGTKISGFVQDSWKISDRLTINPGIRYSIYRGHLESRNATLFKSQAFAPRIGITWDVFGDHTTAVKAHYGKYYDKLTTNKFSQGASGYDDWVMYEVMPDGSKVEIFRSAFSTVVNYDKDLKFPGMDQFVVGVERELAKDAAIGLSFVYKKMKDFIGKQDIGATWALTPFNYSVTDVTGTLHSGSGAAYVKTSPSSEDDFLVTNPTPDKGSSIPTEPYREYMGLFLTLEKRFSNKWMLNASYTLSQQKSTYGGRNANTNPNAILQQLWDGEPVGYLFHAVKVYGTVVLPYDLRLSPVITMQSGPRWTKYIRAPIARSPSFNIEKPGSNQLDTHFEVNLRAEKTFSIKGDFKIGLTADLYNLLNAGIIEGRQELVTSPNYLLVDSFNLGRQWRFGIRIYF